MKKSLLLIVFITAVYTSKAQMWCASGAQWHYGYVAGVPFTYGYLISNYIGDSTISTIVYKKITTTRYGNFTFGSSTLPLILLNENNKLVTLYTGNVDTLFNFNATIGNKWLRVRTGTSNTDVTRRIVTVLDTGHVIINGITLKKLILSYQSGGWATATVSNYTDTVYEKIGSIHFFLNPMAVETMSAIPDLSGNIINGDFRCYSDNNFAIYHKPGSLNCKDVVGINELGSDHILNVYPNPANDVLNIEFSTSHELTEQPVIIEITNALGQVVLSETSTTQSLKLKTDNLQNGLYYLSIKTKDETVTRKIMIQK